MMSMIRVDPVKRLSASEALTHIWITNSLQNDGAEEEVVHRSRAPSRQESKHKKTPKQERPTVVPNNVEVPV